MWIEKQWSLHQLWKASRFSHHTFPHNNASILYVIKSSSMHPWLFSRDSHHIIKLMTVCVFIAFYYKLLNPGDEHVIKSETHSNGWKETVTQSQYTEAIKSKSQNIRYFLISVYVDTHSGKQHFLRINK